MMSSLRSRHLLNGIVIIVIGVLVLGFLLSQSIYQSRTKAIGNALERTALDLLGYIEYDAGSFAIMPPNQRSAEAFLNEQQLLTSGPQRFAYIWDRTAQKIIWDSLDNNNVDQQSVGENFVLFDFETIFADIAAQGHGFNPAQAREMDSVPVATGAKSVQYLVAAQKFMLNIDEGKKDFLFVVATSMENVETDAYDLINVLVLLLLVTAILLAIAQLIFSWWVLAPVKKLEQDILGLGNAG